MSPIDYTVRHHSENGKVTRVWVEGEAAPSLELGNLQKALAYEGLRVSSYKVAGKLGALLALVANTAEADRWLDELNRPDSDEIDIEGVL